MIQASSSAQNATVEPVKCLSRGGSRRTMAFPSRDDVRGLSQAFCASVCLFFWSRSGQRGEQHRKSMVWPSLGASQTLSTDTTISVGNRSVGAREDYLNGGHSQSSSNKHIAVSNRTPSRLNTGNSLCNTT